MDFTFKPALTSVPMEINHKDMNTLNMSGGENMVIPVLFRKFRTIKNHQNVPVEIKYF